MFIYENRKIYSFENQCAQGFAKGGGLFTLKDEKEMPG